MPTGASHIGTKKKKAPRNRRTLIGRVDPETEDILPTDGRRRKNMGNANLDSPSDHEFPGPESANVVDMQHIDHAVQNMLRSLRTLTEEVVELRAEIQRIRIAE